MGGCGVSMTSKLRAGIQTAAASIIKERVNKLLQRILSLSRPSAWTVFFVLYPHMRGGLCQYYQKMNGGNVSHAFWISKKEDQTLA